MCKIKSLKKKLLVLALIMLNIYCVNASENHKYMNDIIQGQVVEKFKYPFFASFIADYNNKPGHIPGECGGTVISDRFIITAAHCIVDYPTLAFKFFLEKYDESDNGVMLTPVDVAYYKNEGPVYGEYSHDIAMVKVKEIIPKRYQTITLWDGRSFPPMKGNLGIIPNSLNGIVIGNGVTAHGPAKSLLEANVDFYPSTVCQTKSYENLKFVPGKEICAGGMLQQKGAYYGDSGGPLFIRNEKDTILLGIVSRGLSMPSELNDIKPSIYTSIAAYKDWIECIISTNNKTQCNDL